MIEDRANRTIGLSWPGDLVVAHGQARAATDIEYVELTEGALVGAMHRSQEIASWAWRAQARQISEHHYRIQLHSDPVALRVARTLVRLASLAGRLGATVPRGAIPLTQKELADLVGATRETVSSMLNDYSREGLLALGRGRIEVLAPEKLLEAGRPK